MAYVFVKDILTGHGKVIASQGFQNVKDWALSAGETATDIFTCAVPNGNGRISSTMIS